MTTWTEADNGASQVYDEILNESVWDNGASVWDLIGNVVLSNWDVAAATSWSKVNGSTWDGGASMWDVEGTVSLSYWDVFAATPWTDA